MLICLGVGGTFALVNGRKEMRARQEADLMRMEALEAEARARRAVDEVARKAEEAEKKTRAEKKKDEGGK